MKPRNNEASRGQKVKTFQGEGPNWILIACGALLSSLSIQLVCKLKQSFDSKKKANSNHGNRRLSDRRSLQCHMHTNMFPVTQDDEGCFDCIQAIAGMKHPSNDQQLVSERDSSPPLLTYPPQDYARENDTMWTSSPDCLELPPKPIHHSNCSDSPRVSESGSDILGKREVIQKLRQQLKRRDDMIMEMQDQIVELQNSINSQMAIATNLQSQLDAANKDLLDSECEIQRLRMAIANHCVSTNGHANGHVNRERGSESPGKQETIEKLKTEVGELKEVIEGKSFLLQNYKEQKIELSMKLKELQQRLDSQLPNIL